MNFVSTELSYIKEKGYTNYIKCIIFIEAARKSVFDFIFVNVAKQNETINMASFSYSMGLTKYTHDCKSFALRAAN